MSAMDNLRLPGSERAKLQPFRTRDHAEPSDDVIRLPAAPEAIPAVTARRRPAHHLSGFARA